MKSYHTSAVHYNPNLTSLGSNMVNPPILLLSNIKLLIRKNYCFHNNFCVPRVCFHLYPLRRPGGQSVQHPHGSAISGSTSPISAVGLFVISLCPHVGNVTDGVQLLGDVVTNEAVQDNKGRFFLEHNGGQTYLPKY